MTLALFDAFAKQLGVAQSTVERIFMKTYKLLLQQVQAQQQLE